jgi:hypothetical protein
LLAELPVVIADVRAELADECAELDNARTEQRHDRYKLVHKTRQLDPPEPKLAHAAARQSDPRARLGHAGRKIADEGAWVAGSEA